MTTEQQRIAHLEKLLDDATGAMALLRKDNERQAAQISALVAENAGLKSAIEFAEPWLPSCDDELTHLIKTAKETPATDAEIAAIRADAGATAIEQFAVYMRSPGDDEFLDAIAEGVAKVADVFAAQLRQEGANHG